MMKDMTTRLAPVALLVLAASSMTQAKAPMESVDVKTVKSADFTAGATVRIAGTAGELNIETWDQPRVEATLTRSEFADADERAEAKQKLERIGLSVGKHGNEITVEMTAPKRSFLGRWVRGKTNATVVCRVMVPRDAKLVVRHEDGSVMVYGAASDIDATARFGDIVVQLADPARYAIDARVKVGGVYTDYMGKDRQRRWVGQSFVSDSAAGARAIHLRVGAGGISIVKMGPIPASGF
jgi:hypothetical protein